MQDEFTITIEQVTYQFKRIFHPDLPLSYHVHFIDWHQPTVFRMRENTDGTWSIIPMQLPAYVLQAEAQFCQAIRRNESGGNS